jgi:putative DNA primase/helicase
MSNYDSVLAKFSGLRTTANGWSAFCPVHEADSGTSRRNRSLWCKLGRSGNLIVKCKRGCETTDVLAAVDLKWGDLFPDGIAKERKRKMDKIAATYDYADESGHLLYQAVRLEPKAFMQRRPDPAKRGAWLWGLGGTRQVLYRLPEIVQSNRSRRVVLVEGEKAVDCLVRHGFLATCNPMGACKWDAESDARHHYGRSLEGCDVVIIGDDDPVDPKLGYSPGHHHVDLVADALKRWAARIRKIYGLPGVKPKGGADDWLMAGGTAEKLTAIINETPVWYECRPGLVEMRRAAETIGSGVGSLSPREWLDSARAVLTEFDRKLFGVAT